MAEAIGLTASIIGIGELAAQATKVVLKLKDVWDQVKEAPDDITYMMLELKVLVSSLETIENQHNDVELPPYIFDMSDMRQSLELCQHAAKQLSDLVTELALQTDSDSRFKRKIGAAKFIMKKDQMQKVKTKLRGSIGLFKLCRETYTITIQPHVVAYRLHRMFPSSQIIEKPHSLPPISSQTSSTINLPPSVYSSSPSLDNSTIEYNRQASEIQSSLWVRGNELLGIVEYETKTVTLTTIQGDQKEMHDSVPYRVTRRSTRLCVRPPTWLLSKCWEALHHNLHNGWTFAFQTYNVVPLSSPVFKCIEEGDLSALQNMLASKQATPFDRWGDGFDLIHYSIIWSKPEVCYLLIDLTKQPMSADQALNSLWMFARRRTNYSPFEYGNLLRRLAAYIDRSPEAIKLDSKWIAKIVGEFNGDLAAFNAFIAQFIPTFWKESQRTRTLSAILNISMTGNYNPDMTWTMLGLKGEVLNLEIAKTADYLGRTLLHFCASRLWQIVLGVPKHRYERNGYESGMPFSPWESIMPRFPPETIATFYQDCTSGIYKHWTSLRPALRRRFSRTNLNQRDIPNSYISRLCDNWCVFLKHLLDSGVSVHIKDLHGRTPLLFAIQEIIDHLAFGHYMLSSDIEYGANTALRVWLEALSAVGVDIQKYGAEERLLYSTGKVNKNMQILVRIYNMERDYETSSLYWRVISLECGTFVEDWHIRISEPTDEYAGQFWTMIDHPEWKLPGAWIQEEDSDDDDWHEDTDDESLSGESERG